MRECTVVELRRYRLHPGRRDELIELFDREFVESQEAVGMQVIGQFRDPRAPDDFVWLRGFADMPSRAEALGAFYGGPVWREHGPAANATMLTFDDVRLLRPAFRWTPPSGERPPPGTGGDAPGAVLIAVRPLGTPAPAAGDAAPIAELETEPSRNNYPALPVREGDPVSVTIAAAGDAGATVPGYAPLIPTARSLLHGGAQPA